MEVVFHRLHRMTHLTYRQRSEARYWFVFSCGIGKHGGGGETIRSGYHGNQDRQYCHTMTGDGGKFSLYVCKRLGTKNAKL